MNGPLLPSFEKMIVPALNDAGWLGIAVNGSPSAVSAFAMPPCAVPPSTIPPSVHRFEQASLSFVLPSSHCSPALITPSPQIGPQLTTMFVTLLAGVVPAPPVTVHSCGGTGPDATVTAYGWPFGTGVANVNGPLAL